MRIISILLLSANTGLDEFRTIQVTNRLILLNRNGSGNNRINKSFYLRVLIIK